VRFISYRLSAAEQTQVDRPPLLALYLLDELQIVGKEEEVVCR
jgi:hypothetical protein